MLSGLMLRPLRRKSPIAVDAACGQADEDKPNQQDDCAAAQGAPEGDRVVSRAPLVEAPLEHEDDTGGDDDDGPPAGVPGGKREEGQLAERNEQGDDADGEQKQRTEDGAAALREELPAFEVAPGTE